MTAERWEHVWRAKCIAIVGWKRNRSGPPRQQGLRRGKTATRPRDYSSPARVCAALEYANLNTTAVDSLPLTFKYLSNSSMREQLKTTKKKKSLRDDFLAQ